MAPGSKPLSYSHDLTRDEIVTRFRSRIAQGKRTKLYKEELAQLILHFIDRIQALNSAAKIRAACEAEIALLEVGYPQSTLASDYIPKYRQAISVAIADGTISTNTNNSHHYIHTQRVTGVEEERFEHYALTYFKYDKDVYESLDSRSADTNRTRQVSLRKVNPYDYLLKLQELLDANDKFAARLQAIAIAGLTGRRIGEVLAKGRFQLSNHPHLLRFEGHQKTQVAAYDIVTLIPAVQLLEYIEQFRSSDEIRPLLELESDALTKAINQLDVQINRECVKHLASIVPPLSARASISIHNLRSLWGAIAVWLFCPDDQHEYPFIQHYLGHAVDSNATGHYFRYQLVDKAGHPLRDKGVKLSSVGELPLFTDEITAIPTANTQNQTGEQSADSTSLSLIPATIKVPADTAAAQPTLPDAIPLAATSNTDFKDEIKADSITPPITQTSVQEQDSTVAVPTPPDTPAAAKSGVDSLITKLSYYERDRRRLSQLLDTLSPTPASQQEKIATLLDWAEQQLSYEITDDTQPNNTPDSQDCVHTGKITPSAGQSVDVAVDKTLTPSTPIPKPSPTPAATSPNPLELLVTQAVTDQARTLGVLSSRVEALESQLLQLQQERDDALRQLAIAQNVPTELTQELEHLQAENTQLRKELDRFEAIRRAFLGEPQPMPTTPAPASAPTLTPTDITPASAPVPTLATNTTSNHTSANSSLASTPKPKSSPSSTNSDRKAHKGAATARAESIFRALITWNQQHPDDTFAMNPWLLEGVFKINRKAAKQFCLEFHAEIEQHHLTVGIENVRSHNSRRNTSAFKAFVQASDNRTCSPPSSPTESVGERVEQAVQAIMDYNNYTATELDQKWAITPVAVAQLSGGDLDSINIFLQDHHLAIADHHAKHQLSASHNSSHYSKGKKIHDCIGLD